MTTLPEGSILVRKSYISYPDGDATVEFYQNYTTFYAVIFKINSTEIDAIRKVWRAKDGSRCRFSYKGQRWCGHYLPAERMW
jgi:hypothetical protein